MNEFLEKDVEKRICNLISHNPGLHVSKIAEILNLRMAEVEIHLQRLRSNGIIFATKEAGYKRYFIEKRRLKAREKRTVETRRMIYDLVAQSPGLHLSKIAEMLDMSIPLMDYHLVNMQQEGEISVIKDSKGYYKRYYIADSRIQIDENQILLVLRKKTPLKIVFLILKHPNIQHKDIMKQLNMPSSSLSYHLTKLEENRIIDVHSHGREKGYTLRNRDEIIRILKKYELHIELNLAVDGFKDMWDDLSYRDSLG